MRRDGGKNAGRRVRHGRAARRLLTYRGALAYLRRERGRHGPRLFFQQVPEDKVAKNRVHLDVRAAPGLQREERMAALEVECDRLVSLGAKRVRLYEPAPPMSAGFIVMTDPEGKEFCLD
ncbi:hypothetical protein J1C73_02830 [Streptomyces laculatispora]|nr:hypothetical protein [Streptomyces laculatispora]